jgi:hypothetical protein
MSQRGSPDFRRVSLTERECTQCGELKPLTGEHFGLSPISKSGFRSRCLDCDRHKSLPRVLKQHHTATGYCSFCGRPEHDRASCPLRPKRPKPCGECYGLAHRRPGGGCPVCGEAYRADRVPSAAALAETWAREDTRTEP